MIRKMARLPYKRYGKVKNDYNEWVEEVVEEGAIDIAISLLTGTTSPANNVITQSSTHIGVSRNKRLVAGDSIGDSYVIDYAVLDGRFAAYYLKKDS